MSNATGRTAPGEAVQTSQSTGLRRFFAIDQSAQFVTWAQSSTGRLVIALGALAAVAPHFGVWAATIAIIAAMAATAKSDWRNPALFSATWATAFVGTATGDNDTLDNIVAVVAKENLGEFPSVPVAIFFLLLLALATGMTLQWVRRSPESFLARRPLLSMLALEGLLCGVGSVDLVHGLPRAILWSAIFVLTPYLWFIPYAIVDQRAKSPGPMTLQMGVLRPFWSPSYLSFNKGAAFLRKHLAQNPVDLAITQLKAIKLLLWANILFAIRDGLGWLFEVPLPIPSVERAIDGFLAGNPYSRLIAWTALIVATARYSLQIAIWAHLFVGIARLAGYRLPRGSWRPLESRTLMDYFNRFHYYFKEFLVDFFFIPTFFKMFRGHPRARMFFATFMAAGVGNALWHFVRDIDLVATQGFVPTLHSYASYAFYALLLAIGVGFSQVRVSMGIKPAATPIGRLYSFFFVWSFVVCMHVFSDGSRKHTLHELLSFMANQFGVF